VTAEKFPHEPFDPIPNHRVAYFATDGNAQPSLPQLITFANNDEIGGVNLPTVSRESQKFGSLSQAGRFRKVFLNFLGHPRLLSAGSLRRHNDRQLLPPFCSPSLEYFAPTGRVHTRKEAVCPFSPHVARLIGSFHAKLLPWIGHAIKFLFESQSPGLVNLPDFRL
jgi:hypothetical protein